MAKTLALTRIIACLCLIVASLSENASALAVIPSLRTAPFGLAPFAAVEISRSIWLWRFADLLIPCALLIALIGYRSRWSLLIGATAYLVEGGLLRAHTFFYHPGVMALHTVYLLALTPCADVWSLDARWGRTRVRDESIYRWSVLLVWLPVSTGYLMAGLNKLRHTGLEWFAPNTLKTFVAVSQVRVPLAAANVRDVLHTLPDIFWTLSAVGSVILEIGYISILWSRWSRLIFPVGMVLMHAVIWFLIGAQFFDFILMQFAVFHWGFAWQHATKFWSWYSSSRMRRSGSPA